MKTIYLFKSVLPAMLLPFAPQVAQAELHRHGIATTTDGVWFMALLQILLAVGVAFWLLRSRPQPRKRNRAFLKMSCVSKKVYHDGQWMTVEKYLAEHHNIVVSHGMTPEETQEWVADAEQYLREQIPHELSETAALPEMEPREHSREFQESAA